MAYLLQFRVSVGSSAAVGRWGIRNGTYGGVRWVWWRDRLWPLGGDAGVCAKTTDTEGLFGKFYESRWWYGFFFIFHDFSKHFHEIIIFLNNDVDEVKT
jgi:hypothetical protein